MKQKLRLAIFIGCLIIGHGIASAQTLAFIGVENSTKDPRLDYLGPIIEGTLLFDLSVKGNLLCTERKKIGAVLGEQELQQLSGLTNPNKAVQAGEILNADWLLTGSYSLAGADVFVSFNLIETQSGQSLTFTDRGTGENVVHRIAERVIQRLSKRSVLLAEDNTDRSILSLRDERPGTLVLYSRLVAAKIFLDGEFAGYTMGKGTEGIVFDNLPPGKHTVRTFLDSNFGVIHPDTLIFGEWEKVVEVKAGRRVAIIDETKDFYYARQSVMSLISLYTNAAFDRLSDLASTDTLSFKDAQGINHQVRLVIIPPAKTGLALKAILTIDKQEKSLELAWPKDKKTTTTLSLGLIDLELSLSPWDKEIELSRKLTRTDIPEQAKRANNSINPTGK